MPKLYSVAEANAALPNIVPLVGGDPEPGARAGEHRGGAARSAQDAAIEWPRPPRGGFNRAGGGRRTRRAQGHRGGCKRWTSSSRTRSHGLIDFLHEREGRVVYLCWKLGEPRVAYWHDIEAGFAGRELWTRESKTEGYRVSWTRQSRRRACACLPTDCTSSPRRRGKKPARSPPTGWCRAHLSHRCWPSPWSRTRTP